MQAVIVSGMVVRNTNYAERDRILSLYTEELGLITVIANGSRSIKSRSLVATEMFCYSRFVLDKRKELYVLREVELIESFFALRTDIEKVALAGYVCEVVEHVGTENMPEPDLLRLSLNTLYALANDKSSKEQIKGAFEMRAAAILGFMPELSRCVDCGEEGHGVALDVMNGVVRCEDCRRAMEDAPISLTEDALMHPTILCLLTDSARAALFYVIRCPLAKILSFRLEGKEDRDSFSYAAETYLLNHLERSFKSLDFYKSMLSSDGIQGV